MHPRRGDPSRLVPFLLASGYAVLVGASRYADNWEDCVLEAALADTAEGIRVLRRAGYEHVVLLGNGSGGSHAGYYQAMAQTPPPDRPTHTPGGTPYDLNALDLPPAGGLLLTAPHLGDGRRLMNLIDPSVKDETKPLSSDPALDMYNPANGFRQPPEPSHYSPAFLNEYRAAQRERVARLDGLARRQINESRRLAEAVHAGWFRKLPRVEQIGLERRAAIGTHMAVARTDADPVSCDPSLQPVPGPVGSPLGPRPDLQNYQRGHLAHRVTAEAWLSTWSGLSSRASLAEAIAHVTVPTFVLHNTEDHTAFPADVQEIHRQCGATDKALLQLGGDRRGEGQSGSTRAVEAVLAWLNERYPTK
ncbi:hypothetical protein [Streptomyces sp. NPDC046805]|uniref:hypothetical protein n=1 Tax=Streptomyces sp. NPDC046805 TaxID=3155134 RepID=UPI0033DB890E